MDIYRKRITHKTGSGSVHLALLSDLHIDAADNDNELLRADLEAAKKLGARISINGDIFDAIVPGDRKRHHPRVSEHNQRDDIFNHLVQEAVSILSPYADLIDVISPGNHEHSILKYHHVDLVSMLIFGLNQHRKEGTIHHGSYRGFQQYMIDYVVGKTVHHFTMFRHHGKGGSAPVTGGALDLDRIRKDFEADLYWIGHKHNSLGRKFTRVSLGSGGRLNVKPQRAVMSAGYKRQVKEDNVDEYGDAVDFSEQFYNVSEQGAQWVKIDTDKNYRTTSTGFVNGMRWTVSDSPYHLY